MAGDLFFSSLHRHGRSWPRQRRSSPRFSGRRPPPSLSLLGRNQGPGDDWDHRMRLLNVRGMRLARTCRTPKYYFSIPPWKSRPKMKMGGADESSWFFIPPFLSTLNIDQRSTWSIHHRHSEITRGLPWGPQMASAAAWASSWPAMRGCQGPRAAQTCAKGPIQWQILIWKLCKMEAIPRIYQECWSLKIWDLEWSLNPKYWEHIEIILKIHGLCFTAKLQNHPIGPIVRSWLRMKRGTKRCLAKCLPWSC